MNIYLNIKFTIKYIRRKHSERSVFHWYTKYPPYKIQIMISIKDISCNACIISWWFWRNTTVFLKPSAIKAYFLRSLNNLFPIILEFSYKGRQSPSLNEGQIFGLFHQRYKHRLTGWVSKKYIPIFNGAHVCIQRKLFLSLQYNGL